MADTYLTNLRAMVITGELLLQTVEAYPERVPALVAFLVVLTELFADQLDYPGRKRDRLHHEWLRHVEAIQTQVATLYAGELVEHQRVKDLLNGELRLLVETWHYELSRSLPVPVGVGVEPTAPDHWSDHGY